MKLELKLPEFCLNLNSSSENKGLGEIELAAMFEIRNTVNGKFYWRFKAINGEIVATSEVYETKQGCKNGIDCIMSNAVFAEIRDQTL